jgi:hypothetical protein
MKPTRGTRGRSQLRNALERILAEEGVVAPQKIRFFRAQMSTIITKACAELPSKVVPSRRCMTLMSASCSPKPAHRP